MENPETTSTTPLFDLSEVPAGAHDPGCHAVASFKEGEISTDTRWEDSIKLTDHKSSVGKVAFSPNGKLLASYSTDDTIRLLDTTTGLTRRILKGFEGRSKNLAFSPDST